jgi:integrase
MAADFLPSPTAQKWHRVRSRDLKRRKARCTTCGCSLALLKNPYQRHRAVVGSDGFLRWETFDHRLPRSPAARPQDRSADRLRRAARFHAHGMTIGEAARRVGITPNALDCLRQRWPDFWRECYEKARAGVLAGELAPPRPAETGDEPGLNCRTRNGIRRAVGHLAAGMTEVETAAEMKFSVNQIREWRKDFAPFWRQCEAAALQALKAAIRQVDEAGVKPPRIGNFFRQVELVRRWQRKHDGRQPAVSQAVATPTPDMTLPEFFRNYVWPVLKSPAGRKEGTRAEYESSLTLWEALAGNPSLAKINQATCSTFMTALAQRPGKQGGTISVNTIRKHATALQCLLDLAGPSDREHRLAVGVIDRIPYLLRPAARRRRPEIYTPEQLTLLLDACRSATRPIIEGIEPADWWQALITFLLNTALRIGAALQIQWTMIDGNLLVMPDEICKGNRGGEVHLNRWALASLAALPHTSPRVFAWPHCRTHFHRLRREIWQAAGIPESTGLKLHNFKKTTLTHLARNNFAAAQLVGGHAAATTTLNYYVSREIAADALDQLPQPVVHALLESAG